MKITKKQKANLSNAVRTYNSLRTKANGAGITGKLPPKASVKDILNSVESGKELREQIRLLKDYKKLSDFAPSKINAEITQGEANSYNRLRNRELRANRKKAKELRKQLSNAALQDIPKLQQEIASAERRIRPLSEVKGRIDVVKKIKGIINAGLPPRAESLIIRKNNLLTQLKLVEAINGLDLSKLIEKFAGMSAADYYNWLQENSDEVAIMYYSVGLKYGGSGEPLPYDSVTMSDVSRIAQSVGITDIDYMI